MLSRLVLGAGSVARTVVDATDRADLLVVTDDEHRAETLRSDGVAVVEASPTEEATLADLDFSPDSVVVASDDGEANAAAARIARATFPDATILGYTGIEASPADRAQLEAAADRVLDRERTVAADVLERTGSVGVRLRQLQRVLRGIDGRLAIVTHDNPDPDAIGSAVALAGIAERVGCEADVCYYGEITHQENRAFINVLDFDLRNLSSEDDLEAYDGFALVDHSRPGVNDQLPEDTPVDVVIDHHPPRMPVEARFVDLRSEVGATSTLMVDYLQGLNAPIDEQIATALLFGIRVDTREFRREVAAEDFEAAAFLLPHVDFGTLQRIEDPSMSPETMETIGDAIRNREREGSVLLSGVGRLSDRDALSQAADRLLDLEGINATIVYGVREGTIYVSARARGADIDLGETLRDAFGRIGSAGGHADMAGAQITLGVLESVEDREEDLEAIVHDVITDRFLDALESRSNRLLSGVYASSEFGPDAGMPGVTDADDGSGFGVGDDADENGERGDAAPDDPEWD
ncbi:MAG: DHH family phosphoesterase [Haloarculaceae archaeon]